MVNILDNTLSQDKQDNTVITDNTALNTSFMNASAETALKSLEDDTAFLAKEQGIDVAGVIPTQGGRRFTAGDPTESLQHPTKVGRKILDTINPDTLDDASAVFLSDNFDTLNQFSLGQIDESSLTDEQAVFLSQNIPEPTPSDVVMRSPSEPTSAFGGIFERVSGIPLTPREELFVDGVVSTAISIPFLVASGGISAPLLTTSGRGIAMNTLSKVGNFAIKGTTELARRFKSSPLVTAGIEGLVGGSAAVAGSEAAEEARKQGASPVVQFLAGMGA